MSQNAIQNKKRVAVIIALILLIIAIGFIGSLQITCRDEHSEADNRQTKKHLSCKAIFRPFTQESTNNKTDDSGYYEYPDSYDNVTSILVSLWWKLITDPIDIITAVIAAFTIGLYLTGRDTAKRQLRAYLFIDPAIKVAITHPAGFKVSIGIRNSGQTPAYRVFTYGVIGIGIVDDKDFPEAPKNKGASVIHPHDSSGTSFIVSLPVLAQDIQSDVIAGTKIVYVWGKVRYLDAFDIEHITNYRFSLTKSGGSATLDVLGYCAEGNEAD